MEKKYVNFQSYEDQIETHYYDCMTIGKFQSQEGIPGRNVKEKKRKMLESSVAEFSILLKENPNILDEENVIREQKKLEKYINNNKYQYSNCYSYINERKVNKGEKEYTVKTGIRITLTDDKLLKQKLKLVHVSSYILVKDKPLAVTETNFEIDDEGKINWKNRAERTNDGPEYYYGSETLEYIAPKVYLKK